jgi:hypothetical protein
MPAGKSTLLKLMTGELMPTEGDVKRHSHLSIAKYHQHSVDALIPELTVIEFFQVPPQPCMLPMRSGLAHLLLRVTGNIRDMPYLPIALVLVNLCSFCIYHIRGAIYTPRYVA